MTFIFVSGFPCFMFQVEMRKNFTAKSAKVFLFVSDFKSKVRKARATQSFANFAIYKPLCKTLRTLRLILIYYGKINLMLAIKITVPKTIFNVLLEK